MYVTDIHDLIPPRMWTIFDDVTPVRVYQSVFLFYHTKYGIVHVHPTYGVYPRYRYPT